MNRSVFFGALAALAFAMVFAASCDDGDDDLVSLDGLVADPVAVDLGIVNGHISLDFSASPLDTAETERLRGLLTTGVVGLTVVNDTTEVSYNLTDGTSVMDTPDAPGEYLAELSADGTALTVTFNNSFAGHSLSADGDYSATVTVGANDFFAEEQFVRQVAISAE